MILSVVYSILKHFISMFNFLLWFLGLCVFLTMVWIMWDKVLYSHIMEMGYNVDDIIGTLIGAGSETFDVAKCNIMAKESANDVVNMVVKKVCDNMRLLLR